MDGLQDFDVPKKMAELESHMFGRHDYVKKLLDDLSNHFAHITIPCLTTAIRSLHHPTMRFV